MVSHPDRLTDLFLGETWSRTRNALVLTGGFVTASLLLEYLLFLTRFENAAIETLHEVFLLDGYLPSWHAMGVFVVVGLAAVHAYLNEGYLPSLLLGWSPVFGNVAWTIGSPTGIENFYLDPIGAFRRTFPEAVVLAALGFVIGLGLRRIRKRQRGHTTTRSESDEIRSAR